MTYGRTKSDRQGYFLSGYWNASNTVKLNAFGSWEQAKYPSDHRYIGTVAGGPTPPSGYCTAANPNCYDPFAPPNPNNSYNWSSQTKDKTWMVGVGADWQAMDALKLTGSYLYINNEGTATFGVAEQHRAHADAASHQQLRQQQAAVLQPEGRLELQPELVVHRRLLVPDVQPQRHRHRRLHVRAADRHEHRGRHRPEQSEEHFAQLPQRLRRVHGRSLEHLLPADDLPVRRAAAAGCADEGRGSAAEAGGCTAAAAPPPAPAPAPAPQVQKITLDSKVLFDFDKAVLKPEGKAAIDSQVVGKLAQIQKLEVVLVTGHTDRLGSDAHNQKLSQRRADAVRDYLVSKGVPKDKIETIGMGEKQPVVQCDQKNMKALIECLQPNRRVDVQVKGESTK